MVLTRTHSDERNVIDDDYTVILLLLSKLAQQDKEICLEKRKDLGSQPDKCPCSFVQPLWFFSLAAVVHMLVSR